MKKLSKFRFIYLAPVLALIALMGWAMASPIGASPDDDYHLVSIWCGDGIRAGICEPGTNGSERVVPEAVKDSSVCYAHRPEVSAACQADTFSLDPAETAVTSRGNFVGEYPPVYYAVMGVFVTPNIEGSVVLMRMLNALLFVGIVTALFALLPVERRPGLIWTWLITTIPLGMFLLASNNPSAWAVIGVGTAWLALLGYFESVGKRRIGLAAVFVVGTIMAAGSRGDAAIFVGLGIFISLVLAFRPDRRYLLASILPLVMGVIALLFFLSAGQSGTGLNGFGGTPTPSMAVGDASVKPTDPLALIMANFLNIPSLWAGVLGYWGLGWFDTPMPEVVKFGAIACFVGVVFVALTVMWKRKAFALAFVGIILWLLPTWVLTRGGNSVGQQLQPRYLLPLIVLFAGIALLNLGTRVVRLTLIQRVLVVATLSATQLVALYVNMRRYVQGDGGGGWNLDQNPLWWWHIAVSPMFVLVISSAAFAALAWIVVKHISAPEVAQEMKPVLEPTSTVEG